MHLRVVSYGKFYEHLIWTSLFPSFVKSIRTCVEVWSIFFQFSFSQNFFFNSKQLLSELSLRALYLYKSVLVPILSCTAYKVLQKHIGLSGLASIIWLLLIGCRHCSDTTWRSTTWTHWWPSERLKVPRAYNKWRSPSTYITCFYASFLGKYCVITEK